MKKARINILLNQTNLLDKNMEKIVCFFCGNIPFKTNEIWFEWVTKNQQIYSCKKCIEELGYIQGYDTSELME